MFAQRIDYGTSEFEEAWSWYHYANVTEGERNAFYHAMEIALGTDGAAAVRQKLLDQDERDNRDEEGEDG